MRIGQFTPRGIVVDIIEVRFLFSFARYIIFDCDGQLCVEREQDPRIDIDSSKFGLDANWCKTLVFDP